MQARGEAPPAGRWTPAKGRDEKQGGVAFRASSRAAGIDGRPDAAERHPAGIPIRRPASVWRLPAYPQSVPVLQIRASYSKNLLLNHSPREGGSLWRGALYAHCAVGPTIFVRASWTHCHLRAAGSLKYGAFCFCALFFPPPSPVVGNGWLTRLVYCGCRHFRSAKMQNYPHLDFILFHNPLSLKQSRRLFVMLIQYI